jgi:hypothetical protein
MLTSKLVRVKYQCGNDLVLELDHSHTKKEKCHRTYLITNEGISRHVDQENLDKCLSGEYRFDREAFFFRNRKAIHIAEQLLEVQELPMNIKNNIHTKMELWSA